MSRPLRLEFARALYRITSRGDRREDIHDDDTDREIFLSILGDVCEQYRWNCHAYCLMDNHCRLLIEAEDGKAMEGYKQFVIEGKNQPSPWESLKN